jgi:nitrous oxidase accessory protein NosD
MFGGKGLVREQRILRFHNGAKDCTAFAGPDAFVRDGITRARCGDTVNIHTGSYNEHFTTSKAIRLQAYDGPVTIGQ